MIGDTDPQLDERRRAFAAFADAALAPGAAAADEAGRLAPATIDALRDAGYLGSIVPTEQGGTGLDPVAYGLLTGEVARACSASRTLMTVHDIVTVAVLRWGSAEMRADLVPQIADGRLLCAFALSESDAGSDAAAMAATLRRDGETLILSGAKTWISFAQIARMFLVFARSEEGITAVLVPADTPGFTRQPIPEMVGTRGAMMAHCRFDACRLPAGAIVGKPGFGLSHVAQTALDHGRYSVAWGAVGIADAAVAASVAFARGRRSFGQRLADHGLVGAHLVRMTAAARAARLMSIDAGVARRARLPDAATLTMLAKYSASKAAVDCAGTAVQLHGARGLMHGSIPERLLRDAKVTEIIEGSSEILETVLARDI